MSNLLLLTLGVVLLVVVGRIRLQAVSFLCVQQRRGPQCSIGSSKLGAPVTARASQVQAQWLKQCWQGRQS
jgi:hypothetical protein